MSFICNIYKIFEYDFFELFTKYPNENDMTYYEHLIFSKNLGFLFLEASIKAFIHAIFPFILENSSSKINKDIYKKLEMINLKKVNKLQIANIKEILNKTNNNQNK